MESILGAQLRLVGAAQVNTTIHLVHKLTLNLVGISSDVTSDILQGEEKASQHCRTKMVPSRESEGVSGCAKDVPDNGSDCFKLWNHTCNILSKHSAI